MMHRPLLISSLIEHAAKNHGATEIVSRTIEGGAAFTLHRSTYGEACQRAKRLANALTRMGVAKGDRVGTLAWNGYRHFELYYGVSGMGAVMHTINPRLFPEQIAYIANHAEDKYVFFDLTFAPLIEALAESAPGIKGFVAMTDRASMDKALSASRIRNLHCYEALLNAESEDFDWPQFDELTPSSLCYTSGTTGNPKGVLYTHRSTMLHTLSGTSPEALNISTRDVMLPVVPMFHVNAWGLPYMCTAAGAKLVFPGAALDGASIHRLFEEEKVTLSAGVPTVWLGLLTHVKSNNLKFSTLRETVIGGSACPPAMIESFERDYGVRVVHAWGMTEMSPIGTVCRLMAKHSTLPSAEQFKVQIKQGRVIYGVEMKIVDADGRELPRDGKAFGDLMVRGQWIVERYFREEHSALKDGWFPTGDVATIDADGYMQITDRSKDVIKSGGEWISSIDLENIAVAHPAVMEAGVIGIAHPKWDERPLLVVVKRKDAAVTREDLLKFFEGKIAKWWMPDDVVFVDQLPHTATGKLLKTKMREEFKAYKLPTA
jgi:fatty-acyl-CoA synthase